MKSPTQESESVSVPDLSLPSQGLFSRRAQDQDGLDLKHLKSVRRSNVDESTLPALITPADSPSRDRYGVDQVMAKHQLINEESYSKAYRDDDLLASSVISHYYTPLDQPINQRRESAARKLEPGAIKTMNQQYQERFSYTNPKKNLVLGYRARRTINLEDG